MPFGSLRNLPCTYVHQRAPTDLCRTMQCCVASSCTVAVRFGSLQQAPCVWHPALDESTQTTQAIRTTGGTIRYVSKSDACALFSVPSSGGFGRCSPAAHVSSPHSADRQLDGRGLGLGHIRLRCGWLQPALLRTLVRVHGVLIVRRRRFRKRDESLHMACAAFGALHLRWPWDFPILGLRQ